MGHLFRAINLHKALREKGYGSVIALLGGHAPSQAWLERNAIPYVVTAANERSAAWEAALISQFRPKVWIDDRLDTDADHSICIKRAGLSIATFDDTGPGAALADLHVAALAGVRGQSPAGKRALVGTDYLIFPRELAQLRRVRTDNQRWLVTLGGSDTYGATISVIKWLNAKSKKATILLGPAFAHEKELDLLDTDSLVIKRSVPSLLEELAGHDLAITGGGLTAFEAAALGVPTVIIANEPWEVAHASYLQSLGCSVFAGAHNRINLDVLDKDMDVECMSNSALRAILPDGVDRVVDSLVKLLETEG